MPRGCRAECFHVSLNGCNFRCLLLEYFEVLPGQSAEGRRKKGRERENVFGMRTRALSLSSFRGVCVVCIATQKWHVPMTFTASMRNHARRTTGTP